MFDVVVVGAGISGLTFAITLARFGNAKITVVEREAALENASTFLCHSMDGSTIMAFLPVPPPKSNRRQVGNGLQVPCNAAHVMRCLGILDKLRAQTRYPISSFKSLAYSDGKELLDRNLRYCEELYGAPWLVIHRAAYMRVLLDEAIQAGVEFKYGCEVHHVDFFAPSVTLANGQMLKADLVVGSDGIHSKIRSLMHPSIGAVPTGEYAYRAMLKRSQLSTPSLQHIVSSPDVIRVWLGPNVNAVLYALQGGETFNLVIPVADTQFNGRCRRDENLANPVKDRLRDWDPVLSELLSLADQLVRFPLYRVPTLPGWSRGYVTLTGDAAHAMMPHLAQGAAAAAEDGFVLGTLLGRCLQHTSDTAGTADKPPALLRPLLRTVLQSYECLQRERTARIASNSRLTGTLDHLPDGPDQRDRDAEFAAFAPEMAEKCVSSMPWIDGRWNMELLGRKADEETEREFQRLLERWGGGQGTTSGGYGWARL